MKKITKPNFLKDKMMSDEIAKKKKNQLGKGYTKQQLKE
jgi:hypothetical protein